MSTFPDQFQLNGRTALITGSGRGLGWEMAQGLAQAGARRLRRNQAADGGQQVDGTNPSTANT